MSTTTLATRRRTIAVAAVGAAAAAGIALVGVTTADAAPAAHHRVKNVYIHVTGTSNKDQNATINGAITGGGHDSSHENYDVLHLGGGTLRIDHPQSKTDFRYHVNHKTCFARFTLTGPFTLGHGTGRFAGVHGSGSYRGKGYGVLPRTRSGACSMNAELRGDQFIVSGKGQLK